MGPGTTNAIEKKNNVLPIWGNEKTMNLNNMILTNILSSHYFKVNLYQLKTYHEVVDEIFYNVSHLEPWEKGSRKTSGQTGMCGGVRGVGAGGIVSTAFCILYKLFTLKLTRKQLMGLINHNDSPYIRGLGFMYIRYTQPPADLWDWYEGYLDDDEELDVKAGGGQIMTMGEVLRHLLSKLEWFSTLFPRIPVPIQKELERKLSTCKPLIAKGNATSSAQTDLEGQEQLEDGDNYQEEAEMGGGGGEEDEMEVPVSKRKDDWSGSTRRGRESERDDSRRHRKEGQAEENQELGGGDRHKGASPLGHHSRSHRHHRTSHNSRERSHSRTRSNCETERSGSRDRRHHHHRGERQHYSGGASSSGASFHHRSSRREESRHRSNSRERSRHRRTHH